MAVSPVLVNNEEMADVEQGDKVPDFWARPIALAEHFAQCDRHQLREFPLREICCELVNKG